MDDALDDFVISVRADTSGLSRDVAAMRAELTGPLVSGAERAGRAIETALLRAVTTGKFGMEDLKRIALAALAEIARAAMTNAFGGGGPSGGSGGGGFGGLASLLTGLLGGAPGRATGGPVAPGRAYRVGERGPEWFVPSAHGRIDNGAGAVRSAVINVHLHGDAGAHDRARMAQTGKQLARAVRRAIADSER